MKTIGRVTRFLFIITVFTLFASTVRAQLTNGTALRFNGSTSKVLVNNAPNLANSSFSLEFWVRRFGGSRGDFVLSQGTTGADNQYLHVGFRSSDTFTFAFWNNDLDTLAYTDQGWHHWACTYNSTNRNRIIYRDGQIVGNDTATANFQGSGVMSLGGLYGALDSSLAGMMDDVRVWNVVRSQSQIQSNMNVTLVGNESGLVSYWKFDEGSGTTVNDSAGGDNTGIFLNSPTWGTTATNYGIAFDGSNDSISIANESSFDFTTACTIEAWIKVDAFTTDYQSIVTKGDTAWRLHRDGGNNGVSFGTTGLSNQDLAGTRNVNDGRWHHVAGVYDGTTKYLYVDGTLDVSVAATGTIAVNSAAVNIGANSEIAGGRYFNGVMDEVRVWSIARSASQIAQNMYTFLTGNESGLVGYWRFNEGGGTIAFDSAVAGGNNDGTLLDGATQSNGPNYPFSVFTVSNLNDSGPGSLRQALLDINSGGSGIIDAQNLSGTITLQSSLPMITGSLTFLGSSNLTVNGNNLYRVFSVNAFPRSLFFSKLMIANGKAQGGTAPLGGGGGGAGLGGGMFINSGNVTLSEVRFSNNSAIGGNGGSKGASGSPASGGGGMGGNGAAGDSNNGGGGGGLTGAASGGAGGGPSGGAAGVSPSSNGGDGDLASGGGGGGGRSASGNGGAGGLGSGGGGAGSDNGFGNSIGGRGGNGGFGGGGGGSGTSDQTLQGRRGGNGGFGGGAGGNTGNLSETAASPGFGGGGSATASQANDRGAGGGGAGLGANIFVRSDNNASLTLIDCSIPAGSVAGGSGGTGAGAGASLGTGFFTISGNTDITVNSGRTETISGTVATSSSSSGLNKNGSGVLVLAATTSVPGPLNINAGTLEANGNFSSSASVVNSGSTLAGSGTVGAVTNNSGSTISPGSNAGGNVGALTATSAIWNGAGNYNWQLYNATGTVGSGWDVVNVNGALNLSSASGFNINLWTLSAPGTNGSAINFNNALTQSWVIAQASGGIVGFNAANFTIVTAAANGTGGFSNPLNGSTFSLAVQSTNLVLQFTARPAATTLNATNIAATTATLTGSANPNGNTTTTYFQYGTNTNYGNTTTSTNAGNGITAQPINANIASLLSGTTYHFRLVATNSAGTNAGSDQIFTTLSADANLSAISPSVGTLAPTFSSNLTSYGVTVPNTTNSINLSATTANASAKVQVGAGNPFATGSSTQTFAVGFGSSLIQITTKAEDGITTKIYNVTVSRPLGTNANLSSLTLSAGTLSPAFNFSTATYSALVSGAATNVTVTAISADPYASLQINGGSATTGTNSRNVSLSLGTNTISILVQSQDGLQSKTNIITIGRAAPPTITSIARQTNGTFLLQFNATAGLSYTLQASTDLVAWPSITNWPSAASNLFNFTDSDATNYLQERFYRLKNP